MYDRPELVELVRAVREFLEQRALPKLEGHTAFHARVSAAHRSAFLTRVPGQNNNDVEGTNESTNVDASISYQLTPNFQIVLEGVNLTNEPVDQFISRARNSVVSHSYTGREYLIGIRAKF